MARNDPQQNLDAAMDSDLVTSLLNREIYTLNGLFVGEVHDVRVDFNELEVSHIVVQQINPDAFTLQSGKDGVLIPYRFVRAVGDVVLMNDVSGRGGDEAEQPSRAPADD